jgi:PucR family transcriptional regulator, proline-responsive transcriptional activator
MDISGQLQAQLDALAAEIGHGLSIDDPHGRLVAYSPHHSGADPARIASILTRHVAPEILAWQNEHGIAKATEPVTVPANPELGMSARLCVPIRRGKNLLGYLWVLEGSLAEAALAAVTQFAARLASGALYPLQDVNSMVGRLPDSFDQLAAAVPALLETQIQICAVVPADVSPFSGAEFRRLTTAIPAALGRSCVGSFVSTTHAIALLRHPAAVTELASVAPDCTIGFSDPAPFEPAAVRTARSQALAAAELSALDPALPTPLPWSGLGPYRALLSTPGTALSKLDSTGLLTLETYLDFGGDAKRTAAHLHLHRTTLYYRLGRVREALGVDLDDGLTRLDLHLALKHRRLARRTLG